MTHSLRPSLLLGALCCACFALGFAPNANAQPTAKAPKAAPEPLSDADAKKLVVTYLGAVMAGDAKVLREVAAAPHALDGACAVMATMDEVITSTKSRGGAAKFEFKNVVRITQTTRVPDDIKSSYEHIAGLKKDQCEDAKVRELKTKAKAHPKQVYLVDVHKRGKEKVATIVVRLSFQGGTWKATGFDD